MRVFLAIVILLGLTGCHELNMQTAIPWGGAIVGASIGFVLSPENDVKNTLINIIQGGAIGYSVSQDILDGKVKFTSMDFEQFVQSEMDKRQKEVMYGV